MVGAAGVVDDVESLDVGELIRNEVAENRTSCMPLRNIVATDSRACNMLFMHLTIFCKLTTCQVNYRYEVIELFTVKWPVPVD